MTLRCLPPVRGLQQGHGLADTALQIAGEGKASIDLIPTGSTVRVQVIATGFATYAEDYLVADASKEITVSMIHPQEQVSSYQNNDGKATSRKPGVQEPIRPTTPAPKPPAPAPTPQTTPQQPPNAPGTTPKQ